MIQAKYLKTFRFWSQHVLPLVYDDSLSYYEVLCKCVDYVNDLIENDNSIIETLEEYGLSIAELEEAVEGFKNGNFEQLFIEYIEKAMKHVYFGLTNAGYFAAYVPENWSELKFSTVMDYNSALYGHLVLEYD